MLVAGVVALGLGQAVRQRPLRDGALGQRARTGHVVGPHVGVLAKLLDHVGAGPSVAGAVAGQK